MRTLRLSALVVWAWAAWAAAVEPADVFGDHMVLQRGKRVPVWGTARPGEKVTVTFADQAASAVADKSGRWLVRLDPLKASTTGRTLTVRASSGEARVKDVVVGDVWIAGGQSNMGRDVNRSWRPANQRMNYPHIRFLPVGSRGTKYPSTRLSPPPTPPRRKRLTKPNRWHVCDQQTTPECCAVGFFFAEKVCLQTGIPQGLLWNAWAGSSVREWVPYWGWSLRPELVETARQVAAWYPSTAEGRAAFGKAVEEIAAWRKSAEAAINQDHPFPFPQPKLPEPDDSQGRGRGTTILCNGRVHPLVPYAIAGILWYQGESDYANRRYLPEIEAMVESWRRAFAAPDEKPTDLPFYFVQLQRCGSYMSPQIRDQQLQSYFTIPNSGMAVLLDLDMNLHPMNKRDAGRRLALWALADYYGKNIPHSGPIYKSHRGEGGKIVVEFTHTHGGLFVGQKDKLEPVEKLPNGKLVNVEVTADGRNWLPARCRIEGERLVAWADGLARPTDARYCWKSKADPPFLYNAVGLPAAQFNTTTHYGPRPRGPAAPKPGRPPTPKAPAPPVVELPSAFTEGCVLQRDARLPVRGWAGASEKVRVSFAGQTKTTTADRFGRWRVDLDPVPARSGERPLVVQGPRNTITVPNVYVGDVWLYLSQSWHLGGPAGPRLNEKDIPPISAAAASVWEHQNHARRPMPGRARGARWAVYRAPGRYFRNDAYYLGIGLGPVTKAPVGVIGLGASTLESMTPPEGFMAFEKQLGEMAESVLTWLPDTARGKQAYLDTLKAIGDWVVNTRATLARGDVTFRDFTQPPALPGPPEYRRAPTTMYNAVIHRFTPTAIRGIVIQPKTFSVGDAHYVVKAKALIHGLRAAFRRQDLPVCFVQMHTPGRYEAREVEDQNEWVRLREAQNQLAAVPNTSVLATYDLKAPGRNEPDMGLRVATWAAAVVQGKQVTAGPTYKSHRIVGESAVVEFENAGSGLMVGVAEAGKPVRQVHGVSVGGFQIAGARGQWHDARATIRGSTVIVTCDKVERPAGVRYAWTPAPTNANLYNREGFAALPFERR